MLKKIYERNTPNPSDIHVNQHAVLPWKISCLREGNLISIHWADMTDCLVKDTATSPRTMKLCILMLTVTENNDNHCWVSVRVCARTIVCFFFLLLAFEGWERENYLSANTDNYEITTKFLLTLQQWQEAQGIFPEDNAFFIMVPSKEKEAIFFKCPDRFHKPNSFLTYRKKFIHPVQ